MPSGPGRRPVQSVAGQDRELALHPAAQPAGPGRAERGPGPADPAGLGQVPEGGRLPRIEPGAPARAQPGFGLTQPLQQRPVRGERRPFQTTSGLRITIWTWAPRSCSSAADSRADWPAPTTMTRWPANTDRSVCAEACVQSSARSRDSWSGRTRSARRRPRPRPGGPARSPRRPGRARTRRRPDRADQHLLDVQAGRRLEPLAVGHERVQRHGQAVVRVGPLGHPAERAQRQLGRRVGQVGREALGLEEHAPRHVRPPQVHRQAELPDGQS